MSSTYKPFAKGFGIIVGIIILWLGWLAIWFVTKSILPPEWFGAAPQ